MTAGVYREDGMSDELRQAAERLIDPGKAGRVPDNYAAMIRHADQFWEDARAVAAAWLAEHPAERPARDGEGWCPLCLMNCLTFYGASRCCGAKAEAKRAVG
jgi:hypothetical protein